MKFSQTMLAALDFLARQEKAAARNPGAYSPFVWPGFRGFRVATAKALHARGLVRRRRHPLGNHEEFAINERGRMLLASFQ